MKKISVFIFPFLLLTFSFFLQAETSSAFKEVNVFVGTGGLGFGVGSTSPAACVPFGMLRSGPDELEGSQGLFFSSIARFWMVLRISSAMI